MSRSADNISPRGLAVEAFRQSPNVMFEIALTGDAPTKTITATVDKAGYWLFRFWLIDENTSPNQKSNVCPNGESAIEWYDVTASTGIYTKTLTHTGVHDWQVCATLVGEVGQPHNADGTVTTVDFNGALLDLTGTLAYSFQYPGTATETAIARVSNVGTTDSTLNWTASLALDAGITGKVSLSVSSGAITGGNYTDITVSFVETDVALGDYTGILTVTDPAIGTKTLAITVSVIIPEIQLTGTLAYTSFVTGATGTEAKTAVITNVGDAGSTLVWTGSLALPAALSAAITADVATGSLAKSATQNVALTLARTGVAAGSYSGTYSVAAPYVTTRTLPITLTVVPDYVALLKIRVRFERWVGTGPYNPDDWEWESGFSTYGEPGMTTDGTYDHIWKYPVSGLPVCYFRRITATQVWECVAQAEVGVSGAATTYPTYRDLDGYQAGSAIIALAQGATWWYPRAAEVQYGPDIF
jgi:hypothetical protein